MIFALLMAATTLAITWIMAKAPSLASPGTPLGGQVLGSGVSVFESGVSFMAVV